MMILSTKSHVKMRGLEKTNFMRLYQSTWPVTCVLTCPDIFLSWFVITTTWPVSRATRDRVLHSHVSCASIAWGNTPTPASSPVFSRLCWGGAGGQTMVVTINTLSTTLFITRRFVHSSQFSVHHAETSSLSQAFIIMTSTVFTKTKSYLHLFSQWKLESNPQMWSRLQLLIKKMFSMLSLKESPPDQSGWSVLLVKWSRKIVSSSQCQWEFQRIMMIKIEASPSQVLPPAYCCQISSSSRRGTAWCSQREQW